MILTIVIIYQTFFFYQLQVPRGAVFSCFCFLWFYFRWFYLSLRSSCFWSFMLTLQTSLKTSHFHSPQFEIWYSQPPVQDLVFTAPSSRFSFHSPQFRIWFSVLSSRFSFHSFGFHFGCSWPQRLCW